MAFYEGSIDCVTPKDNKSFKNYISPVVRSQLINLGGVPENFVDELLPYISSMQTDFRIHSSQEQRVKSGHVFVQSFNQMNELLKFISSRCSSIEYKGCYAFYYDDIFINNVDSEVVAPKNSRFVKSSNFAFNLECKLNGSKLKFRISILVRKDDFRSNSKHYDIRDCYLPDSVSKIMNIASYIENKYNKIEVQDRSLEDFIKMCRDEVKNV
jgi:hypothetical protein